MAVTRVKTSSLLQGMPKDRSFLAGNEAYDPTDFESIATVSVGSGGSANVEFTSIGTDWTHLQIRALIRGTKSTVSQAGQIQFNSDTTAGNYTYHRIFGDGSSAGADGEAGGYSGGGVFCLWFPCATSLSSTFGAHIIDVLDYRNTNKYKTVRTLLGWNQNFYNSQEEKIALTSNLWQSTSAITSIKLQPYASDSFAQYSRFALYGIKG